MADGIGVTTDIPPATPPALPLLPGIDAPAVTAWLAGRDLGLLPPLDFALVAGGRSNLTYAVTDGAGTRVVLRRPPTGHVLATAHDMAREHRLLTAVDGTGVPAPRPLALCVDPAVTGAPFLVMSWVDGTAVRSAADARTLSEQARRRAGFGLVEALAALHALDVDAVGLGDLGPRDGYAGRQLRRWSRQVEASFELSGQPVPLVLEVRDRLVAAAPPQLRTSVVHGDYRLENVLVADDGTPTAVLDWELAALGDPLADLGHLVLYSDPAVSLGLEPPASVEGFPSVEETASRYSDLTGAAVSDLPYYVALSAWRVACILAGVHARYAAGAGGGGEVDVAALPDHVERLAALAGERLDG